MWPFRMRADPEPKKTETETSGDALLRTILASDCMTRDQAMNVPAFAACVNKITETISTAKTFWEQSFMKTRIALLPFHHTPYAAWGN